MDTRSKLANFFDSDRSGSTSQQKSKFWFLEAENSQILMFLGQYLSFLLFFLLFYIESVICRRRSILPSGPSVACWFASAAMVPFDPDPEQAVFVEHEKKKN